MSQGPAPPADDPVSSIREAGIVQIAVGAFTGALWLILALPVGMCTDGASASHCGHVTAWYVGLGFVALTTLVVGIVMTSRARAMVSRRPAALLVAGGLVAVTVVCVIGLLSTF